MTQMRTYEVDHAEMWLVAKVHGTFGEEELRRLPCERWHKPGVGVQRRYELDVTDGLVYKSQIAMNNPRYHVARGGELVRIEPIEVADIVDPVGKRMRGVARQARQAGLDTYGTPRRFVFDEPHGLAFGDAHIMGNGALAFVTKATKLQAWLRRSTKSTSTKENVSETLWLASARGPWCLHNRRHTCAASPE